MAASGYKAFFIRFGLVQLAVDGNRSNSRKAKNAAGLRRNLRIWGVRRSGLPGNSVLESEPFLFHYEQP